MLQKFFAFILKSLLQLLAGVAVISLIIFGLIKWDDARKRHEAENPPTAAATRNQSTPANAEKEIITLAPGRFIQIQDVSISIASIKVAPVSLINIFDERGVSTKPALQIVLAVENKSETRKVNYKTWRENVFGAADLKDNFGNAYSRITYSPSRIVGGVQSESIHPRESQTDVLVYEPPLAKATHLTLTLSGENVGVRGDFEIRLNAADWNNFR